MSLEHGKFVPHSNLERSLNDTYLSTRSRSTAPLANITGIQMGLANPDVWRKLAVEQVTKSTVSTKGIQQPNTINSAAAGPSDRNARCMHCKINGCECESGWLILELGYICWNQFYVDRIVKILNCVCPYDREVLLDKAVKKELYDNERDPSERLKLACKACSRIRVHDHFYSKRKKKIKYPAEPAMDAAREIVDAYEAALLKIEEQLEAEKVAKQQQLIDTNCCGGVQFKYMRKGNSIVRQAKESTTSVHFVLSSSASGRLPLRNTVVTNIRAFCLYFGSALSRIQETSELLPGQVVPEFIKGKTYYVSPAQILDILRGISPEDQYFLGSDPVHAPCKDLMMEVLPIPPGKDRPDAIFNTGNKKKAENPANKRYWDIAKVNELLRIERCKIIKRERRAAEAEIEEEEETVGDSEEGATATSDMIFDASEMNGKVKSTITAVFRGKKAHEKAVAKKEACQEQLELVDGKFQFATMNRSGDPTISDAEWSDFSTYDAAFYTSTRALIEDLQYLIGSSYREDAPAPKNSKRGRGGGNGSIRQRLKGKRGHIRGKMQARRNDHSMRGVITPNPNLDADELGIPQQNAMIISIPEVVTDMNIDWLRRVVKNGPDVFPGANYVSSDLADTDSDDVAKLKMIDLRYIDRYHYADHELKVGMVVHRHIMTGDYIPFNRQPSLHKFSFMCHRARIVSGQTFEMNQAACKAYGADLTIRRGRNRKLPVKMHSTLDKINSEIECPRVVGVYNFLVVTVFVFTKHREYTATFSNCGDVSVAFCDRNLQSLPPWRNP